MGRCMDGAWATTLAALRRVRDAAPYGGKTLTVDAWMGCGCNPPALRTVGDGFHPVPQDTANDLDGNKMNTTAGPIRIFFSGAEGR
jgi:hypothetical protein